MLSTVQSMLKSAQECNTSADCPQSSADSFPTGSIRKRIASRELRSVLLLPLLAVSSLASAGSLQPVLQVVAGSYHTCARTDRNEIKCWGWNHWGQLGNDSTTASNTPVSVVDGSGVPISDATAMAVGDYHNCVQTSAGGVKCWGINFDGQLGDLGTLYGHSGIPVEVVGSGGAQIADVSLIAAGGYHSCALRTADALECWGSNYYGELGNGTNTQSTVPVAVPALSGRVIAVVGAEYHSCVLLSSGAVKCWGDNEFGQVGNNSSIESHIPADVVDNMGTPLSHVTSISANSYQTCALTTAGSVMCWGSNYFGQLGNNTKNDSHFAVSVLRDSSGSPLSGIAAIAVGSEHACAMTTAGTVKCWGHNSSGQLGNHTTTDSLFPVDVLDGGNKPLTGVTAIVAGGYHSCVQITTGAVECWGLNDRGQLGDGTTGSSSLPVRVVNLAAAAAAVPAPTLGNECLILLLLLLAGPAISRMYSRVNT